jgi:pimeloyl-ACP methyl ester carboxylesterase
MTLCVERRSKALRPANSCERATAHRQRFEERNALLAAVGADRFPLFGISQGAPVAVEYVVRHPDRVGLILHGGYARGRPQRAVTPRMRDDTITC